MATELEKLKNMVKNALLKREKSRSNIINFKRGNSISMKSAKAWGKEMQLDKLELIFLCPDG